MQLKTGFYVMTGEGQKWSDYEGPFTIQEAVDHLKSLCGHEFSVPEMMTAVVVSVTENKIDLVRSDNGVVLNGEMFRTGNSICFDQKVLWERNLD